ncbi:MAG: Cna B-type domain-containing protein [Ruminococcus sp.]|nr:Cna B-type domain-containing protein [Ruminococcus sp.]
MRDIPLPRHTLWQLPDNFKGTLTGEKKDNSTLYDKDSDRIYLYHPYQLAVMAKDDADSQPVMDGDADAESFGSGKVIPADEDGNSYLTYSGSHNYVVSSSFTSEVTEKPVSVVTGKKKTSVKTGANVSKNSVGATSDGRDFPGQVIKKIDGKTYILIGNEAQLRAIGTDAEVWARAYSNQKMIYGGDADLNSEQNGSGNFTFHSLSAGASDYPRAGVNQDTGEVYTDISHVDNTAIGTAHSWKTGEKYTNTANYIIFRDIDLGGQSKPWTPLMFSGTMYGSKSAGGEKLWNGSGIADSTELTAEANVNRPVISNVYINQSAPIEANKYIGIGFFATVTNEVNVADIGVSAGTVKVRNIELNQVAVHNTATTAKESTTIVSALTSSLGWIVGGLVDLLTTALSFGSVQLSLRDTLSDLLNARTKDPTIYSTGAFAGRVVGDVEIKDCAVTGNVTVESHKDNTGGFVGYTNGVTEYSGLSQVLGGTTGALESLLNVIPGLGLGDLITILLDNALPLGNLIPTGFYEPHILSCTVDNLQGDIGQSGTNNNGGFVGLQIGTQIENSTIQNSDYTVKAASLGGGFSGVARDAEIKGTLNDLGVDVVDENQIFSGINEKLDGIDEFQTQSLLRNCSIDDSDIAVQGGEFLGGFTGALAASYAIDCGITSDEYNTLTVIGSGDHIGGFAGEATLGWFNSIGKDAANQNDNSLLAVVRQLGTGLLSSGNKGQNQKLLSLVGLVPSAIMGCQIDAGPVNVSGRQYVGGILGRGQGVYLTESSADYMNQLSFWSQENDNIQTKTARNNSLNNLESVTASGNFAGGAAGELETVNLAGVLDGTLSAGSFKSFTVSKISVTGLNGGYDVKAAGTAQDFDGDYAGGGFGRAYGGIISDVTLSQLNSVEAANNKAAGFIASAGPGDVLGSGGLTINLLGLNYLLNVKNLLSIGQHIHVKIKDSSVTGVDDGFTVEAKGSGNSNEGYQYTASGFIAQSNSTELDNCHTDKLLSVKAASLQGYSGGFVGVSATGGLADVSDVDGIKSLLSVEGSLLNAVEYLIPSYTNCTVTYVDGGYVDADIAGGFAADMESGTVNNSTISTVDDSSNPKWSKTMKELHDPDAVNATGDLQKQFAVFNIGTVYGLTYGGGFGGKLRSGALADAGGGISILGDTDLSIDVNKLSSIMNAYIPVVDHAGVYSEDGFTVAANEIRSDDPYSGSAGGFAGYTSGVQISHSDVYKLKNTTVTPPADLESTAAPSYFDSAESDYAVVGGHYAGGYVGNMDIGSAASLGNVSIIGLNLNLGNLVKAAQVFVPTVKSGTVHGWQSGMTVECFGTDYTHQCGYAGGYAGSAYGAQIWGDKNAGNASGEGCDVTNLRFVKGTNCAGGYIGMATAASVADVNTNSSDGLLQSILNNLISSPGNLASVLQATVTTVRKASVNPDKADFGFTVSGVENTKPRFSGGFAGSLEAAVIGSRKGESDIVVNGLRSVDGLYYAGGFVGLADVGSVAAVSNTGNQTTNILGLINAGSVDLLYVFRTYIYYSDVNGVSDGMVIRAYESAPEGILSETRRSGCAGGFGGGIMNGSVKNSNVTNLNSVSAPNYAGGFIGHMGKNGIVDLDDATIQSIVGVTAGVLDIFGTVADDCKVEGIDAGAVIVSGDGAESIAGGFSGYADVSQIKRSNVTNLKQVYSDQIAGGFVGKTNMNYLVELEADSPLVQIVLDIVNGLIRTLQVDDLENLDLLNLSIGDLNLKLLTDGDVLYVNLLGLRIGVSLVKSTEPGVTDTALVTIGDSTVALPYNENGIDTNTENAEAVVNLIKGNRTRADNCSVTGIEDGYDVYGGGASNTSDGSGSSGYAGGFIGYNNEGKFTSNTMVYCDVIRGTAQKVGTFSGGTSLESVYSFNTLEYIEKVAGEENHYYVYRNTDMTYALTSRGQQIGSQASSDQGTDYKRFDIVHLAEPITPGTYEPYYKIFEKWNGAKLASSAAGDNAVLLKVYVSNAKADLMTDTPTYANDESLIPNPGENNDPCGSIDLTIQKIWKDKNNAEKSRPDQIQVRIWQHWENENGTPVMVNDAEKTVLFTDSDVISDVDTTDGWFTLSGDEHGRPGSATWTRTVKGLPVYSTIGETTYYFSYTVEEAPVYGYNSSVSYDETGSTTTAAIVNTPQEFEIEFKYYDRYEISGKPAGIESEETVYSVSAETVPNKFITYDNSHAVQSIDFSGLIGEKAVEFSENALAVTNVMCDYDLWTSQSAAVEAMSGRSYFVDGKPVSYGNNTTYHTDYLGKPNTHPGYSGETASENEKWVNYYDADGNELEESFTTASDYVKVKKIVVWCYNYPKLYDVNIYGADSFDDLTPKTFGNSTVYVADPKSADNNVKRLNDRFYYNQRFGGETGDDAQDSGGFIENYGLPRYTGVMPADYAAESVDGYNFAYWAYDREGTQIASVERDFWYRVTTDTKLYAVYAPADSMAPGISISANDRDTYVDSSGVSRTRLNILAGVYGAPEKDKNIQKLSFVNVSFSTQIRNHPEVYTPERINKLFLQYKEQLKDIIEKYDRELGSKTFSAAQSYNGAVDETTGEIDTSLSLTLTTKGYIFTVVSNGNTPAAGDSTASLTNKNRAQFTPVYKTSALNVNGTGSNGDTCLMYCAALKYQGEWSVSNNCLIYLKGDVVKNTADSWNSEV